MTAMMTTTMMTHIDDNDGVGFNARHYSVNYTMHAVAIGIGMLDGYSELKNLSIVCSNIYYFLWSHSLRVLIVSYNCCHNCHHLQL
jgi:hypothetical protein